MRAAINLVNQDPAPSTIVFSIPGDFIGLRIIRISSALPAIQNRTVTIDGTTQAGYSGLPLIEITPDTNFLLVENTGGLSFINSNNSREKGLCINQFKSGQIVFTGGSGNRVEDSFIGTDPTGTRDPGAGQIRGDGIVLIGSAHNVITRNLISANNNGVAIRDNTTSDA